MLEECAMGVAKAEGHHFTLEQLARACVEGSLPIVVFSHGDFPIAGL